MFTHCLHIIHRYKVQLPLTFFKSNFKLCLCKVIRFQELSLIFFHNQSRPWSRYLLEVTICIVIALLRNPVLGINVITFNTKHAGAIKLCNNVTSGFKLQ
jgi:hypothetical protein